MNWAPQLLQLSLAFCLLFSIASDVSAQETKAADKPVGAGEQDEPQASESEEDPYSEMTLDEIGKDYSAKLRAYSKRYRAAPTKAEKRAVFKTIPNVKPYWPRLIEMIDEADGTQTGLDVVDWWYRRGGRREGTDIIMRLLVKNYSQKETVFEYVPRVAAFLPEAEAEAALREMLEGNPFDSVKAAAYYELHELLRKRAEGLDGETADEVLAKVKVLRDTIYTNYPDAAGPRGAKYTGLLDAVDFAANLEIGKPVPDIVGVDLEGVNFKLSDYDGKVRVISFWGDW